MFKNGGLVKYRWQIMMMEDHTNTRHHAGKGLIRLENAHAILCSKKHEQRQLTPTAGSRVHGLWVTATSPV